MITVKTIQFLEQLKNNNTKAWFDANRVQYEVSKKEFLHLNQAIIEELSKFDATVVGLEAKACLFRINRDVRFSNDKSPYKTNFSAYIAEGGKKSSSCGYYFHLEPGKSAIGGGMWQPDAKVLAKVRQEIDYNFNDFKKIIKNASFVKSFGSISGAQLKTTPKGYPADHPAIEYLKYKSWIGMHSFTDKEITDKAFVSNFCKQAKVLKPLLDFFNTAQLD
jgi:uncharacterized protein (TIGR02453 family)